MDSLDSRGLEGTSASKAYAGLDALGTVELKGTSASRMHPGLDSLDETGSKASSSTIGGTNWVSRRANTWVCPVDGPQRRAKA